MCSFIMLCALDESIVSVHGLVVLTLAGMQDASAIALPIEAAVNAQVMPVDEILQRTTSDFRPVLLLRSSMAGFPEHLTKQL